MGFLPAQYKNKDSLSLVGVSPNSRFVMAGWLKPSYQTHIQNKILILPFISLSANIILNTLSLDFNA